jgi:hypothetical protein
MLTELQRMWVYTRGGRTERDVYIKNGELGVDMVAQNGVAFIPVPDDKYITIYRDANGYIHDRIMKEGD